MQNSAGWLEQSLRMHGVTRRDFLRYCGTVAALFALPKGAGAQMAEAAERSAKPSVIYLEFQDCAGNTESLIRASRPDISTVILDTISLDYQETLMAAAGHQAEDRRRQVVEENKGKYIAIVEGSIPTGANGAYCTIGGRSALDIAREVCGNAAATIAFGTCAAYGGIPAAAPNPTGALSVREALPEIRNVINVPACPANPENLTALILYYLSFNRWPPLDRHDRPLFAYGKAIHDACERRAHFDAGQYVEEWGDYGHRHGWCLYKMGCKGPVTWQNCPTIEWNAGTDWPIGCGSVCLGCSEPLFWDRMTPFYSHLSGIPGFRVTSNVDTIGLAATAAVGVAFGAHGLVKLGRRLAMEPKHEEETVEARGKPKGKGEP